jgi:DNA-binding GntR family transcriptional regulator
VHVDLHLTDGTELHASSRVDDTGRPFAEIQWDFHGPLPGSTGNNTLWGTSTAMRRLAELILEAAIQAEEEACWQAHQAATAAAGEGRVA